MHKKTRFHPFCKQIKPEKTGKRSINENHSIFINK
jgi:hypothetical protein